jgi:hypothetical protein
MPSVISSVPTNEGFVIGSDGRSCGPEDQVISDTVQKIFPFQKSGIRLAYGMFGTARIGLDANNILFDFHVEIPLAMERASSARNWWEFLSLLTKHLTESLDRTRAQFPSDLDPDSLTTVTMGGFYGKFLKLGHIQFNHKEHTEAEPHNYATGFSFPWGSIPLFELLNSGDPRFAAYANPKRVGLKTLADGVERVHKDILLHYDPEARKIDEKTCSHVGGLVQIATLTFADGFKWVPGFEPVEA